MDSTDATVQPMGDITQGPVSRRSLLMALAALGIVGSSAFELAPPAFAAGAQLPFPSSTINPNNPYGASQGYGPHRGIDFAVGAFLADGTRRAVGAAAPGKVLSVHRATDASSSDDPYGSFVDIDHGTDAGGHRWHSRYHMLWEGTLPGAGDVVAQGQTIGYVDDYHLHRNPDGTSNWRGQHLHFEVHSSDTGIAAHSATYYGVTRRCVDPAANIGRVPTNNFGSGQPSRRNPEDIDMPIIGRQATGDTYSLFPHRIKHHMNAQDSAMAHYVRDADVTRNDVIQLNDADLRIVLHEFGFGDIAADLNARLPKSGAAVDRIDQIIAKLNTL